MDINLEKRINILYIIIIVLFMVVCTINFGATIYSPYSDIGRELYVPEQISNGIVLYKDILNVYPPLAYILNSCLTKLAENNLSTYLFLGLFSSILTIIPIYLITKIYTNKHIAFITSLFICSSCTFFPSISNWILPYSYGIVYALSAIVWSFYNLIKFEETNENKYLYLSSLLAGLSLCFKYEYLAFILVIILMITIRKTNLRTTLKSILLFLVFPLLSLIILFIQKCSISDLITAFNYIISLIKSQSTNFFYNFAGIRPDIISFQNNFIYFINQDLRFLFYPITYICAVCLILSLTKKEYKISILLLTGLLLSIKSIGGISLEIYGTYFLPILLIGIISFIYKNPNKVKSIILYLVCFCLFINYTINSIRTNEQLTELETKKGKIKIQRVYKDSTEKIIEYITKNTKQEDKILILPEGTLINYLTERKSENYLYYLIPPNNDILGKELIINRLKQKDINYIIVTNIQYPWYKEKSFMTSWGEEYINIIKEEYKLKGIIGNNLQFYIYSRDIIK